MTFNNFRDLSETGTSDAGFQYEFYCAYCTNTWRTAFKPYRRGQIAAMLSSFSLLLSGGQSGRTTRGAGRVASMGERGAKESALADAREGAAENFRECGDCRNVVCLVDCWIEADGECKRCVEDKRSRSRRGYSDELCDPQAAAVGGDTGPNCPNCSTAVGSGRFCPDCGFDLASTHKTCPVCGTVQKRASRFCTDCGHSF